MMPTTGKRPSSWTQKEDRQLRKVIGQLGTENWEEIAAQMPGRPAQQCSTRWNALRGPNNETTAVKSWTEVEDWKVMDVLVSHGRMWNKMAERLYGRNAKEIQSRWDSGLRYYSQLLCQQYNVAESDFSLFGKDGCLRADIDETELIAAVRQGNKIPIEQNVDDAKDGRRGRWTEEEDRCIVDFLMEHGTNWLKMSELFENRSSDALCTRYYHGERRYRDYLVQNGMKKSEISIFQEGATPRRLRRDIDPELLVKALRNKLNRSPQNKKSKKSVAQEINEQSPNGAWSEEEDRRIVEFLMEHGTCWMKMAEAFEGRTKVALSTRFHHGETRYITYMKKKATKKSKVTLFAEGITSPRRLHPDVDKDVLVKAMRNELNKNTKGVTPSPERKRKVASIPSEQPEPGHYASQLQPEVRTSKRPKVENSWRRVDWSPREIAAGAPAATSGGTKQWTEEEDRRLLSLLVEIGTSWKELMKRFTGRSYDDIRNRWRGIICRRYTRFLVHKKGVDYSSTSLFQNEDHPRRLRRDIDIDEVIEVTHNYDLVMMRATSSGAKTPGGQATGKRKVQSLINPTVSQSQLQPEVRTSKRPKAEHSWRRVDWSPDEIAAARAAPARSGRTKPWTKEEDRRLLSLLVEIGTSWKEVTKRFKGRSYEDVRNRWHSIIMRRYTKFLVQKKGVDDSNISLFRNVDHPRRLRRDIDIDEVVEVTHSSDLTMMPGAERPRGPTPGKHNAQSSNSPATLQLQLQPDVYTSERQKAENSWRRVDGSADEITAVAQPALAKSGGTKSWTKEEDRRLLSLLVEIGTSWKELAKRFTGRSCDEVRNRWRGIICRRYTRFLVHKKGFDDSSISLFQNEGHPRRLRRDIDIDEVIEVTHNYDLVMMRATSIRTKTPSGPTPGKHEALYSISQTACQSAAERPRTPMTTE